jgi:hypothetical protein
MAPSFGDGQIQALHALSVVDAARTLVAEISRAGGHDKLGLDATPLKSVLDALRATIEQVNRLGVFETRARARGTVSALTEEELAGRIKHLRSEPLVNADQEELRDMPQQEIDDIFQIGEAKPAPPDDGRDPFSI